MYKNIYDLFFGEDVLPEHKIYNTVQLVALVGAIVATFLVWIFIPDERAVFYSVGMVILAVFTMIEPVRTGNYIYPTVIMSFIFNFGFLTILFLYFDKMICCIPAYFIMGLLYTIMMIPGKIGLIIMLIEAVYYFYFIIAYGKNMEIPFLNGTETIGDYIGVVVAVFIASFTGGLAVYYRVKLHQKENNKLEEYHAEVMDAYNSKDIFLINMSHEIRTPMNAIVGNVNLLLNQDVNDKVKDSVYNILNSCNALLSITNELMDLSKSDSEEMVIYNTRYDISELVLEIINMISVRMMEGDVEFVVDIAKDMPKYLYGDSSKIRQLFINILNNAVKYTKEGYIKLRIYKEDIKDDNILLCVEVKDTGIGIKEESKNKLFNLYQRVDENDKAVRNIEGTGIGLTICKEIVDKMGGSISVESIYHEGSTFTFKVPQKNDSDENIINLIFDKKLNVLVFEKDDVGSDRIKSIMKDFDMPADYVYDSIQFENMLNMKKYDYIFIDREHYMQNIKFIDVSITDERLVILSRINQNVSLTRLGTILTRPVHILNVASILHDETTSYIRDIVKPGSFVLNNANILVVDDNLTNLNVARGLLKRYEANVITALSGKECLNILENQEVDMIFMDYMMPEMNGIDTLNHIRSMDNEKLQTVPVIALTANVVNGAREMFLEAGFNDYISKPIAIDRIEKALMTFIPRSKILGKNK